MKIEDSDLGCTIMNFRSALDALLPSAETADALSGYAFNFADDLKRMAIRLECVMRMHPIDTLPATLKRTA